MRETLQRVVPAAALVLVAAAGGAQAAVEVCNGFKDAAITVAMARHETGRIHIRGWYTVEAGKCLRLDAAANSIGRHSFLARHEETKVVWPKSGQGVLHCVKFGPKFTLRYPTAKFNASTLDCGEGYEKRLFVPVEPQDGNIKYTFE